MSTTGIGSGSNMTPAGVPYGTKLVSTAVTFDLYWDLIKASQQASARINGTFYVYHETGHGLDDYFVVYMEDGVLNPVAEGKPLSADSTGRGFYQVLFTNSVSPTDPTDGSPLVDDVNWVSSSPPTVNQDQTKQSMIVDSFSDQISLSLNAGIGAEGGSVGASAGVSTDQAVQIWNSAVITISDWGIDERTDGAQNKASWTWHQQEVWDPLVQKPNDFKTWWKQVYDENDGVLSLPDLSTNALQYHSTASWRFQSSLIDSSGCLNVQFVGQQNYLYAATSAPGFGNSTHHTLRWSQQSSSWNYTMDLVEVAKQVSGK